MIPIKQKFKHDPKNGSWGDCHRACIASLFELDYDTVPHFAHGLDFRTDEGDLEFIRREEEFLNSIGLSRVCITWDTLENVFMTMKNINPGVHYILGGHSSIGVGHSVIAKDDKIVHDPSGSGIVGPMSDGMYWVSLFVPKMLVS